MLLHLSRLSFWFAALAAGGALLVPAAQATGLTVAAGIGALAALGLYRGAVRERRHDAPAEVPAPAALDAAALAPVAAAVWRAGTAAPDLDAALRAVGELLRTELGARSVTYVTVSALDATAAQVVERFVPHPLRPAERCIPLGAAAPAARALATGRPAADATAAAIPVVARGDRPVPIALVELHDLSMPVEPAALERLLTVAQRALRADAPRVLLVEDKVTQSEVIARKLRRLGARVTPASGMLEAGHALRASEFDVVLAAPPSAPSALQVLRRGPWVALGGAAQARELGFDDCLSTPLRNDRLADMLKRHARPRTPADTTSGGGAAVPGGADPNAPVELDAEALGRLRELDPTGGTQLVERVLKAFQTSSARLLPQLQAARTGNDLPTVRLVAHTLKSSSSSIGALALSQRCATVENAIRTESTADLDAQVDALLADADAALQAVQRQLEQL